MAMLPNTKTHFRELISRFKKKSGCGVLVNTSFNVRSERWCHAEAGFAASWATRSLNIDFRRTCGRDGPDVLKEVCR